MSKSPNIFLPALGVTGLVLGAAYGLNTRGHGEDRIAALEARVQQVEARASSASGKAASEEARAAELEAALAEMQSAAQTRSASLTAPAPQPEGRFGLGRAAHPEEIAAWDVDVLPDGRGLPEGSGDVWTGEEVFVEYCAACHGDFAEGVGNWPVLAGGFDTLANKDPVKTVGSYWPYLSTVWDYVHRSMPFGAAGTLTADETYAITAYILYSNNRVEDDFVLSHETFAEVEMYNAEGFVIDDRPETEYAEWSGEPCMENCKDAVEVTMRSVFLVETPPEGGSESVMNDNRHIALPGFTAAGAAFVPEAPEPVAGAVQQASAAPQDEGAALLAEGEKVFKKCAACHKVGAGARNGSGPQLNGLMGRVFGSADGFTYSGVFQEAEAEGRVWDAESLAAFLAAPKEYMKGTKMSFRGLRDAEDVAALTAYLAAQQ